MKKDVLVIGAAILDVLARPTSESVFESGSYACEDIKISFGGDALNDAILLSKMGKSVELISVIGNDREGHMIADKCKEHSIELRNPLRDDIQTGVNIVLVKEDGSRHFLTNANGSLRKLCLDDVIFLFDEAKVLLFASIFVFPLFQDSELSRMFAHVKSKGMTIVCDMTKCKNNETISDLKCTLPYIDYLIPNDEEICLFTRSDSVEEACVKLLDAGVKNLIVKCGKRGCYVANASECYWVGVPEKVHCIDSTGAGDSFVSGFIKKLLEGESLKECAFYGNVCGGKCVQVLGATEWL